MNCKELNKCLCCTSDNLRTILDLGTQSPANNYNVKERYPLKLNVCLDCSHAQLSHSVDPDILFKDYPYMSGVSSTMRDYYRAFAETTKEAFPESKSVYEIACNDGAQLDEFKKLGFDTFGIDPAENLHEQSTAKGHQITCGYFPQDAPERTFDIVVAQNVVAHNPDPYGFLIGCKSIMHKDSILILQTSQAKMLDNHQADTIYHEHISFFNKRSFSKLFNRCDLMILEHKFIAEIHGGSDLYILKKMPEISILDYSDFSNRCYRFSDDFRKKVNDLQKTSQVICYGAAAKMINLIRFTGIEPDAIIDDTPTKQGKLIDGKYPICPSSDLEVALRGSVIIPVWNFYDEIKQKVESKYPGKFKYLQYTPNIQ
jgi:2-polyprenyl-3-methyl-5-hydroxy-6-metoxy-1,4-benzoquinol methylase